MCGIAGSIRFHQPARRLELERLQHRGPDATGQWWSEDRHVWMGHTRLAIQDLSAAGAQPMNDPATGNLIVFNGEIYNHTQLRQDLGAAHGAWSGRSDTETLLAGYRTWGSGVLPRLKGMFSFAVHDPRRNGVFLARDRCGIKPLYYVRTPDAVHFASEARLLIPYCAKRIREDRLVAYLRWGACPDEDMLHTELRTLPAGHWAWIGASGEMQVHRYWPVAIAVSTAVEAAAARVRILLETAVREHLVADVPVACFLSGGLDSSILTALAAKELASPLRTFSVGFAGTAYDESTFAEEVARHCGTEHERINVGPDEALDLVREAVQRMDSPSVDAINTYIVARKVSERGIKVALSGLGADELFGGYPSFKDMRRLRWLAKVPRALRGCLGAMGRTGDRLRDLPRGDAIALTRWRRCFWTDSMLKRAGLPGHAPNDWEPSPAFQDDFARTSWAEMTGYMRHMLLRDSDQMSMAVSLELRVPFLDHALIEFVLGLPAGSKTAGRQPKSLLVESCRDLLPATVLRRRKQGFALPMGDWIAGPLRSFSLEGIEAVGRRGLMERSFLREVFESCIEGRMHWTRLWSLVVLGHYLNKVETN